jgi:hypothetical protein
MTYSNVNQPTNTASATSKKNSSSENKKYTILLKGQSHAKLDEKTDMEC